MKEFILNLQLFTDSVTHTNVTTDTRNTTTTPYDPLGANTLSAEMKTFYDMTLIDEASASLVHDQFGQKRPIPKNGGKTIEFRKFSPLPKATTALSEGVTPVGKRLDVTAITATVAQYGDYIQMSDVLDLTALDNVVLEATKLIGKQAGSTLDTITRDILVAGTNVTYCPNIGVGGAETAVTDRDDLDLTSKLTTKVIKKVVAKLRGQNAPTIGGKYVAIIHPYVAYDLMNDPEWIDAHKYANPTNLYEGEIGEIAGVRFVESTEAKIWNDSTCPSDGSTGYYSVFATLFLGEGAYGVTEVTGGGLQTIIKQKGSAGTADPLDQRATVGWKAIKTAERLVENYMVRVESCSPDFAAQAAN